MINSNNDNNSIEPITFEEFAHYLQSFNSSMTCHICGNENWKLSVPEKNGDDGDFITVTLPGTGMLHRSMKSNSKHSLLQNPFYNILLMTCADCGNINIFNYQDIYNKIRNTKGNEDGQ